MSHPDSMQGMVISAFKAPRRPARVPVPDGSSSSAAAPKGVLDVDATFTVDPAQMFYDRLENHGSRYLTFAGLGQTLDLLRQRRIRAVVTRTFPLEGAEEAHELLRKNAPVGRAALIITR